MQTIVLSNSIHETYAWADAQGRHRRTVRHIPAATSLQGRAYDGIVELPSFAERRDRHAVLAAVKKLKRSMPNISHEVDAGWINPPRKARVPKAQLEPTLFLFANAPVEAPLGDVYFAAVAQEAEEDFSIPEDDTGRLFADTPEVTTEVTFEASEAIPEAVEVTNNTGAPVEITSAEAPKKRGRRTNEQKAYDEALTAWETNGGARQAVEDALIAVADRHPNDDRINAHAARFPVSSETELDF